jgi:hypothetical protein
MNFEQNNFGYKKEKKENKTEKLDEIIFKIAERTNKELGENLLEKDGSVSKDSFNNIYSEEKIKHDENHVRDKQIEFSGAYDEKVQEIYKKQYNLTDETNMKDQVVEKWKEEREKSKPAQLEKASTILFYKILKDDYIVARSSTYDDYKNGIDNILVNKKTGEVICAFDEVHGKTKNGEEKRKMEKTLKSAKNGGTEIDYGITYKNGKVVKEKINNVPIFYLSIENEGFMELINNISDIDQPINNVELKFYNEFIDSLKEQAIFLEQQDIPNKIKNKIVSFKKSLESMKKD